MRTSKEMESALQQQHALFSPPGPGQKQCLCGCRHLDSTPCLDAQRVQVTVSAVRLLRSYMHSEASCYWVGGCSAA